MVNNSVKNHSTLKSERMEPWIKPLDSLVLLYQLAISLILLTGNLSSDDKLGLLGYHALFSLALIVLLWYTRNFSNPVIRFFKEFYPLMVMLYFYREIGLLVHSYFDWSLDEWLLSVDLELGRWGGLWVWNFQKFYPPTQLLNEFFSIGYSFYFFLLPMSALVLYFRAPLSRFRTFMFSLSFTYYLHYILFIFLPAESPRFFMPGLGESLKGYWVADWLQAAVEKNAFAGGSFPSSHIAASIICFMAYRYLGKWRYPVLFLTLALFAGTIYGRYHYFIDVVAGFGVGFCCYFLAPWLEKKWPLVFDEEGIARERPREALDRS
jgi:membrane-associated phospholipid phosphatase